MVPGLGRGGGFPVSPRCSPIYVTTHDETAPGALDEQWSSGANHRLVRTSNMSGHGTAVLQQEVWLHIREPVAQIGLWRRVVPRALGLKPAVPPLYRGAVPFWTRLSEFASLIAALPRFAHRTSSTWQAWQMLNHMRRRWRRIKDSGTGTGAGFSFVEDVDNVAGVPNGPILQCR